MRVDVERVERRKARELRVNRTHIRAFLDNFKSYDPDDEIEPPADWRAMRPYVFGQEVTP